MNILHLKYAVEVEKNGSITGTAENLHMGQPNLSKAIKELEHLVGFYIFKRSPRGVIPTKKGREFLIYAKNIINQLDEMEEIYTSNKTHEFSFSISAPRASYISFAFTQFLNSLDEFKEIKMDFMETNSINTINNVFTGEYCLGIIRYQLPYEQYYLGLLKEKELSYEYLLEFSSKVLMSADNPMANLEIIDIKALGKYTEILHGDTTISSCQRSDEVFEDTRNPGKKRIYVYERGSQFDILTQVPGTYMLTSSVPEKILSRYNLIQRECVIPENQYKDVIIYNKKYRFTNLDKKFVELLKNGIIQE